MSLIRNSIIRAGIIKPGIISSGLVNTIGGVSCRGVSLTIGTDGSSYGFELNNYGTVDPTENQQGYTYHTFAVTAADLLILQYGALGDEKPIGIDDSISVNIEHYGTVFLGWDEGNTQYSGSAPGLNALWAGMVDEETCITIPFASEQQFYAATYFRDDFHSVVQYVGAGTPSTTHASPMWALDHEGVAREFPANEPVWKDGRVVTNELLWSEDFTQQWVTAGTASIDDLGDNVFRFNLPATNDSCSKNRGGFIQNDPIIWSIYLKTETGTGDIRLRSLYSASDPAATVTVTNEWKKFTISGLLLSGSVVQLSVRREEAGQLSVVLAKFVQCEKSVGRTDTTTPSEHIKTTSAPVTRVFQTANGNSVTDNVVTEGTGADLDPQPTLAAIGLGLNLTGTQFGVLDTPFVATGDHSLTVTIAATGTANQELLSSTANSGRWYIHGTNVRLVISPDNVDFKSADLPANWNDGKSHEFKVVQNGTGVDYYMDDVFLVNQPSFSIENVAWDQVAVNFNQSVKLTGTLYSTKLTGSSPQTYNFDSGNVVSQSSEEDPNVFLTWTGLTDASVQRSVNTFSSANWSNELGPFELEFESSGADETLVSVGGTDVLIVEDGGVGNPDILENSIPTNNAGGIITLISGGYTAEGASDANSAVRPQLRFATVEGNAYVLKLKHTLNSGVCNDFAFYDGATYVHQGAQPLDLDIVFTANGAIPFVSYDGLNDTFNYTVEATLTEAGKVLALTDQTNTVQLPIEADTHKCAILYEQGPDNGALEFTGSEYGVLSTPISTNGNCELEIVFEAAVTIGGPVVQGIFGHSSEGTAVEILNDGKIRLGISGIGSITSTTILSPDTQYTVKLVHSTASGITDLYLNGTKEGSSITATLIKLLDPASLIAKRSDGYPFQGKIYSIKYTDLDSTANNQTYTFDTGDTEYMLADEGNWSDNLMVNSTFDTDLSGYANIQGQAFWENGAVCMNDGIDTGISQIAQGQPMTSLLYVKVTMEIVKLATTGSDVRFGDGNNNVTARSSELGVHSAEGVMPNNVPNYAYLQSYNGWNGSCDNLSLQKLNKAVVFTGIDASNWVKGAGKMGLYLDGVYSPEEDFDNSFGTGNLVISVDSREIKRHAESIIEGQRNILDGTALFINGTGWINL